jgi:glycosyltransferase involved in cell wall biosynthesis
MVMRFLLIHQFFLEDDRGGGGRWNEMSRMWIASGHEVTVLAGMTHYMGGHSRVRKGRWFYRETNKDGVEVIRCFDVSNPERGFLYKLAGFISFTISSILAGIFLVKERYDVIIVTSPPLFVGISGLILSWCKGVPFVFEVRDLWPESAIQTGVLKNKLAIRLSYCLEKLIYKEAGLISVLTPAFRTHLIEKKKVHSSKIIYIPNGADFELANSIGWGMNVSQFREKQGMDDMFTIVYVGAHGIANDLSQVLNAAEKLSEQSVLFLLIGNGVKRPELIVDAAKRKLKNLRFIDEIPRREAFRYILASDMGISVLQKNEVFKTIYSNKTFDYLSCRKPVLMAIDGISRGLIEEANAGVFVEPENTDELVNNILFYKENPELVRMQGENGFVFVQQHFDRTELAKQYLNYLVEI